MLITLAALLAAAVPPPASPELIADAIAAELVASSPQVGLSIAVSHGGATFAKGYGQADARTHVAASGGTVHPICSISKNFAAASTSTLPSRATWRRTRSPATP